MKNKVLALLATLILSSPGIASTTKYDYETALQVEATKQLGASHQCFTDWHSSATNYCDNKMTGRNAKIVTIDVLDIGSGKFLATTVSK